jgi:hypothetical protein
MASCRFAIVPAYVKKQSYNFSNISKKDNLYLTKPGYYYRDSRYDNYSIFFFKNDICAKTFLGRDKNEIEQRIKSMQDDVNHYIYIGDVNVYWGTYSLSNDTIKTIMVNRPSFMSPTWMPIEERYVILDSVTIKRIAYERILDSVPSLQKRIFLENKQEEIQHFQYIPNIPDYNNSWILKYKWFWKNEDEYIDWMKFHKIKK